MRGLWPIATKPSQVEPTTTPTRGLRSLAVSYRQFANKQPPVGGPGANPETGFKGSHGFRTDDNYCGPVFECYAFNCNDG